MKEHHDNVHNVTLPKTSSNKISNIVFSIKGVLLVIIFMCLFILISYMFLLKWGTIMIKNYSISYDQLIDHVFTFRNVLIAEIFLGIILVASSLL